MTHTPDPNLAASLAADLATLKDWLEQAEHVLVGAGAGLSTAAGYTYSGPRFAEHFAEYIARYHFTDMYSAGFYPFATLEERWGYWSRHIYYNRYVPIPKPTYSQLLRLVANRDYFVLTTNVDHSFQRAGFDKQRLFYTQGDYGLWQCSRPCHPKTYDNEAQVRRMLAEQQDCAIPSHLVPWCPVCGAPMAMNLRADATFVEDEGWEEACTRYQEFLERCEGSRILYLELGVGSNTPVIIKYPFWRMTLRNPRARYVTVNLDDVRIPPEMADRSLCLQTDINLVLDALVNAQPDN